MASFPVLINSCLVEKAENWYLWLLLSIKWQEVGRNPLFRCSWKIFTDFSDGFKLASINARALQS
jgi:hypothetical protein